jgi:hypothetical protein
MKDGGGAAAAPPRRATSRFSAGRSLPTASPGRRCLSAVERGGDEVCAGLVEQRVRLWLAAAEERGRVGSDRAPARGRGKAAGPAPSAWRRRAASADRSPAAAARTDRARSPDRALSRAGRARPGAPRLRAERERTSEQYASDPVCRGCRSVGSRGLTRLSAPFRERNDAAGSAAGSAAERAGRSEQSAFSDSCVEQQLGEQHDRFALLLAPQRDTPWLREPKLSASDGSLRAP